MLAAQTHQPQSVVPMILLIVVMIFITMLLGAAILALRRRMFDRGPGSAHPGSMLDELRRMHKSGRLSDAEFETARRALSAKLADSARTGAGPPRPGVVGHPSRSDAALPGAPPGYDSPADGLPDQPRSE